MARRKLPKCEYSTRWRPSRWLERRCRAVDKYYAKCQKVAHGHHSTFPYMKRYEWLIKHDYGCWCHPNGA